MRCRGGAGTRAVRVGRRGGRLRAAGVAGWSRGGDSGAVTRLTPNVAAAR